MLLTRVITALAMLPVVLGMLFFASAGAWALFMLVIALVACWEWSRMCGLSPRGQGAYLAASGAIGAFLWLLYLRIVPGNFAAMAMTGFIIATLFWVVGAPFWLANKMRPSPSTCAVAGWIVAWPAWLAFVVLRDTSPWLLLALAALVWVADIAAYFSGKRFGKHKLAPAVSPSKTWEGVYGALAGVLAYGAVLAWVANTNQTPLTRIFDEGAAAGVVIAMLVLTGVSVVGDLFESWMKRGAGLKDSSNLLPGHGGVLDRIDALTSTLPVAALALYGGLKMKRLAILGSTGSVGANTLDVVERHPDRFEVVALTAGKNDALLLAQCKAHRPRYAVMADADAAERLRKALADAGLPTEVSSGAGELERVVSLSEVDAVMAAIVGAAGLPATLAAARAGKDVMLANKEALVMSGALFMAAMAAGGGRLLPIDSEHSAVFQSLPRGFACGREGELERAGVARILLTASGGPFRTTPLDRLAHVTPQQACAHPNWVMGRKISVDSATMMNKGLEVIEAHWLFAAPPEAIGVVIHPQSVIHSMVEYRDGSVIAQLGAPDMRTPIACALAWPERIEAGVAPLDFTTLGALEFERVDQQRFPCMRLAAEALRGGGTAPATLNAANEIAVESFLEGRLAYSAIPEVIENVLGESAVEPLVSLEQVYAADIEARALARRFVARRPRMLA